MNFETILGSVDFLEFLRGKKATFLLSASVTKTCEIPQISQAGIPGKLYLTPTLDAEFLCVKEVRSLEDIAKTPKGVPTPALITRAIHELKAFSNIEILNLDFRELKFNMGPKPLFPYKGVIICDESSMVNDDLFTMLEEKCKQFNCKIIFCGDKAQLRPVNALTHSKVFNLEDKSELKHIYRQSSESGLVDILPILRNNIINI